MDLSFQNLAHQFRRDSNHAEMNPNTNIQRERKSFVKLPKKQFLKGSPKKKPFLKVSAKKKPFVNEPLLENIYQRFLTRQQVCSEKEQNVLSFGKSFKRIQSAMMPGIFFEGPWDQIQ